MRIRQSFLLKLLAFLLTVVLFAAGTGLGIMQIVNYSVYGRSATPFTAAPPSRCSGRRNGILMN